MSKKTRLPAKEKEEISRKLRDTLQGIDYEFERAIELAEKLGQKKLVESIQIAHHAFRMGIDISWR